MKYFLGVRSSPFVTPLISTNVSVKKVYIHASNFLNRIQKYNLFQCLLAESISSCFSGPFIFLLFSSWRWKKGKELKPNFNNPVLGLSRKWNIFDEKTHKYLF
jgi:hypothetical protein